VLRVVVDRHASGTDHFECVLAHEERCVVIDADAEDLGMSIRDVDQFCVALRYTPVAVRSGTENDSASATARGCASFGAVSLSFVVGFAPTREFCRRINDSGARRSTSSRRLGVRRSVKTQREMWPGCLVLGLIVIASVAIPASGRAQARNVALEDSIRALETRRAQALLAGDTAALSLMIADDFVEISRVAQVRTKADNIREIATGALKLLSVHYDSLSVRIYGDVAILMGIADNAGTFRGSPFAGKLRYTRVFVRRPAGWQAVAMQHTLMP
jgi:ketosteroid isomerase-like protein